MQINIYQLFAVNLCAGYSLGHVNIGIVGVKATSIVFGIDQLLNSPWDDQSILIYWLTWIWYLIAFLLDLQTNSMEVDNTIHILVSQALSILIVLFVSIRLFFCLLFSFRKGGGGGVREG